MTPLLFILSCPVRVHDAGFGVMTGTVNGAHFKLFPTLRRAKRYQTMQAMFWHSAGDVPLDFVLIDDANDPAALTAKLDREYERRALPRPTCVATGPTADTLFGRLADWFDGLQGRLTAH